MYIANINKELAICQNYEFLNCPFDGMGADDALLVEQACPTFIEDPKWINGCTVALHYSDKQNRNYAYQTLRISKLLHDPHPLNPLIIFEWGPLRGQDMYLLPSCCVSCLFAADFVDKALWSISYLAPPTQPHANVLLQ